MILLHRPTPGEIDAYLARAAALPFSYPQLGASRDDAPPVGFVADHRRVLLGLGDETFAAARECLRRWDMFDLGWVSLCWPHVEPVVGATVAPVARLFGSWWLNACRVVYVEEPTPSLKRFRFAYGTLTEHVEAGEERFSVEQLDDGTVWYDLYAFSRPGHWMTRVAYPAARQLQWKFGRDSLVRFGQAVRRRVAASSRRALA